MRRYTLIVILNKSTDKVLMCKRVKEPYLGLYNLIGGKIEKDESCIKAAYRELEEETGITRKDTSLTQHSTFDYRVIDCLLSVFVGILNNTDKEILPNNRENPLEWIDIDGTNFFDMNLFAGEGNIGTIIYQLKNYSNIFEKGIK